MMPRPLLLALLCCTLWTASVLSLSVTWDSRSAHSLLRSRRANSFLEELKPGNLERECVEEVCDFEEAREIHLTREATLEFWTVYTDGNQCRSSVCVHGACVDLFQAYACRCELGYEGRYCDQSKTYTNCSVDNGGCDHNCEESEDAQSRSCSCVDGYKLQDDHRKCEANDRSSCGQLLISRSSYSEPVTGLQPWVVGGEVGKKGESPWQQTNSRGSCRTLFPRAKTTPSTNSGTPAQLNEGFASQRLNGSVYAAESPQWSCLTRAEVEATA